MLIKTVGVKEMSVRGLITPEVKEFDWNGNYIRTAINLNDDSNMVIIHLLEFGENEGMVLQLSNELDLGVYVNFDEKLNDL